MNHASELPAQIMRWMRGAAGPVSIRDVSNGLAMNHETTTYYIRIMVRRGELEEQQEKRFVPKHGWAKLYKPCPLNDGENEWESGTSLSSELEEHASADLTVEINGALATWSRWVKAGRPRMVWQRDAHLAMSMAMDRLVVSMAPHERAAVEKVWGVRADFQSRRHDLSDAYDAAFTELRSFYRVDAVQA